MSCFWDGESSAPFNVSLFKLKVGKRLKEFDDKRETTETQTISIKNITNFETWKGSENGFLGDIAILILEDYIKFKPHILPVCIDYDLKFVNDDHRLRFGLVVGSQFGNSVRLDTLYEVSNTTESIKSDKFCIR